jgi:hypothetical protein
VLFIFAVYGLKDEGSQLSDNREEDRLGEERISLNGDSNKRSD